MNLGVIENELATEITMAFNFLTNINLKSNLEKLGIKMKKLIIISIQNNLNTMEKDLLKSLLKI